MEASPPRRKQRLSSPDPAAEAAAPSLDSLPPEILEKIISCLHVCDAVRTCSWRRRWESTPASASSGAPLQPPHPRPPSTPSLHSTHAPSTTSAIGRSLRARICLFRIVPGLWMLICLESHAQCLMLYVPQVIDRITCSVLNALCP